MSTQLRLDGVDHAPDGGVFRLHDVHLHLDPGWTGLIGPNGAGKTTLLRVLAGEVPCGGRHLHPSDARVVRLDQQVATPSDAVVAFATAYDKHALRLQRRLDLVVEPLDRWTTLSPGERRRWQIAAARYTEPEVLLLDEPDNHLDRPARAQLLDDLRRFRGIGLVVSHDRSFLDALTTATLRLRDGRLDHQPLPATEAMEAWDHADRHAQSQWQAQRREVRRARRDLSQARARHDATSRGRSLRRVDPRDHDARSSLRKGAAAKAEAAHAQSLARARGRLERAETQAVALSRPPSRRRRLAVEAESADRPVLCTLDLADAGGPFPLRGPRLTVASGDRIWLEGPNGAGKSTLLRHLLAAARLPDHDILVLPQTLQPDAVATARSTLDALPSDTQGHTLTLLAALGADPAKVKRGQPLSPGESRQLLLAVALRTGRALLALDEPTHHLDLNARERLTEALLDYPGAVLLVCHDDALAQAVCTARWSLSAGTVEVR